MFRPVVPLSGYAGWTFLKRTREAQREAFGKSAQVQRDTAYFRDNIARVKTADDLVADRRLLGVALGAYGLGDDIDSTFFVKKVLSDGTLDSKALSNRLSDKRYLEFSRAFGFGLGTPNTVLSDFGDRIVAAYKERQFEIAIGEQDENMRLALGYGRDLEAVVKRQSTEDGRWFAIMGNPPLRKVFETALGLPSSFGTLDLDLQLKGFREAARRSLGTDKVSDISTPELQEKAIRLFLVRGELQGSSAKTGAGRIALTLLQSMPVRRQSLF